MKIVLGENKNTLLRQFSFAPKKVFALLVVLIFNVLLGFIFRA